MKRLAGFVLIAAISSLVGCAVYKPVPDGFAGPVAVIRDSAETESGSKGRLFYVAEVDGNHIDNALTATKQASYGRGFSLFTSTTARAVPIRPMRLKLVGSHVVAAPIHELASRAAGTFFRVEGVTEFTPTAAHKYVVRGELKKDASNVWIEDDETNEVVTAKVTVK